MERIQALGALRNKETMIEHETQRMQAMRDNGSLKDPSELEPLEVKRQTPVTPHMVTMSVEVLVRNAALKAIGKCKNYGDETNAIANIEEAEGKSYEADDKVATEEDPYVKDESVVVDPEEKDLTKVAAKSKEVKASK